MIGMRRTAVGLGAVALALTAALSLLTGPVTAAPEPGVVPTTWELTFKHHAPERLIMQAEGDKSPEPYWYVRYTVTNNTGEDLLFTPEFELITDTGQKVKGNKGVDDGVFKKIKELHRGEFMESPLEILGRLLQGEDQAKDGVMMFKGVDKDARKFTIYVGGLSGETATVINPVTKEPVVLRKTLVLEYDMPGEAIGIAPQPQFKGKKWVMR